MDGKTRLRLSHLDETGVVHHRVVEVEAADGRAALALEPGEASGALVAVDLVSGAWGHVGG
jgi:hypothetical protein